MSPFNPQIKSEWKERAKHELAQLTQFYACLRILAGWMPGRQIIHIKNIVASADLGGAREVEKATQVIDAVIATALRVVTMPSVSGSDKNKNSVLAHLHYQSVFGDWYIMEKDCLPEQHQAFGWVKLNGYSSGEFGYISISELIENDVWMDVEFHEAAIDKIRSM